MHLYGFPPDTLEQLISRPATDQSGRTKLLRFQDRRLERWELAPGQTHSFRNTSRRETTLFVERGRISVNGHPVGEQRAICLGPGRENTLTAHHHSIVYAFSAIHGDGPFQKPTSLKDVRKKYWGSIATIVDSHYAGKRIFCRKGAQSSLEFHCRKFEGYFIHSGSLLLRLRAGRGEDRFFRMSTGSAILIPPGLMHQRGGLEDTVIIELSTRDSDSDSFLVEDGKNKRMPRLPR